MLNIVKGTTYETFWCVSFRFFTILRVFLVKISEKMVLKCRLLIVLNCGRNLRKFLFER